MEKYFDVLLTCPLFCGVQKQQLSAMLACWQARVSSFDKKYTVLAENGSARYIGIVLSGTVHLMQIDYLGNRNILARFGPGQSFGEAFACAGLSTTPIGVVADEPCDIMLLDAHHVLHTCENHCAFHQQIIFNLMRELAAKNIYFHQTLDILSKRSTREKLLAYLWAQSQKNQSRSFDIPFNRQELADYLQVERSGLSSEIGKLQKEGIIRSRKKQFELLT